VRVEKRIKNMRRNAFILLMGLAITIFSAQGAGAVAQMGSEEGGLTANPNLSDKDPYLDLNSGKEFRLIYDDLNDIFNREDLFSLDLFVNLRTKDTFWLEQALVVNHALLRDAAGAFKVDPMKVKRDGDGYKVKEGVGYLNSDPKSKIAAAAAAAQSVKPTTTEPNLDMMEIRKTISAPEVAPATVGSTPEPATQKEGGSIGQTQ
jgi:hypothetical protein